MNRKEFGCNSRSLL